MSYELRIDDNFSPGDHYLHSKHDSAAAAITACRSIVDDFLVLQMEQAPGLTALEQFKRFGEDPFIVSEDKSCEFSARQYAADRCRELIPEGAPQPTSPATRPGHKRIP